MDLQTAASWAEIIGLITIVSAAIYSWFQIKELRLARNSSTAMNLAANFQNPDFVAGLASITYSSGIGEKLTGETIEDFQTMKDEFGDDWPKVVAVLTTWESIGALVYRGDMDFHAFYDLFSGEFQKTYEVFSFWLDPIRERDEDKTMEWFIWLYDRVKEYEQKGSGTSPAHIAFKDWKPKNRA